RLPVLAAGVRAIPRVVRDHLEQLILLRTGEIPRALQVEREAVESGIAVNVTARVALHRVIAAGVARALVVGLALDRAARAGIKHAGRLRDGARRILVRAVPVGEAAAVGDRAGVVEARGGEGN